MAEAAFRAYDFDADPRWKQYANNLTFPPGLEASSPLIKKYQAKFYKREIDPSLNIDVVLSGDQKNDDNNFTPKTQQQPQKQTNADAQQRPKPQSSPSTRTSSQTATITDAILLLAHIGMVLTSLAAIQPFNRYLSFQSLAIFTQASLLAHGIRLYRKAGIPSNISSLRQWIQKATSSTEGFYLITTLLIRSNPVAYLGVAPMSALAVYHIFAQLNKTMGHTAVWKRFGLARAHGWLTHRQALTLQAMAVMEIGLGVTLVIHVFSAGFRALMPAYVYINQLRMRYWSPESRNYHVLAWRQLGNAAHPVLVKVPILDKVVALGKRWFASAGGAQTPPSSSPSSHRHNYHS